MVYCKKISNFPQFNLFYLDEKLDFIGRFENIQKDFDIICDKIGIPKQNFLIKTKVNTNIIPNIMMTKPVKSLRKNTQKILSILVTSLENNTCKKIN